MIAPLFNRQPSPYLAGTHLQVRPGVPTTCPHCQLATLRPGDRAYYCYPNMMQAFECEVTGRNEFSIEARRGNISRRYESDTGRQHAARGSRVFLSPVAPEGFYVVRAEVAA